MKKKVLSIILMIAMVATMSIGCSKSSTTTTTDNGETPTTAAAVTEAATPTAAATADAAANATDVDLSKATVGVCIYQFSDNFMTLFRTELENYLVSLGFDKNNITIRMVLTIRLLRQTRFRTLLHLV
jgi:methyl-galactoside transport system substrate-binding protein